MRTNLIDDFQRDVLVLPQFGKSCGGQAQAFPKFGFLNWMPEMNVLNLSIKCLQNHERAKEQKGSIGSVLHEAKG